MDQLRLAVQVILPGERLLFGLDDTPTKRAGHRPSWHTAPFRFYNALVSITY